MSTDVPSLFQRSKLGLSAAEFRQLGYRAVEMAAEHLEGIAQHPVFKPMTPQEREALLTQPLPEQGISPESDFSLICEGRGAGVFTIL